MTVDERYLCNVRSWIRLHPDGFIKAYPPRQVNNLYFDDPNFSCYNANLSGVGDRRKLRLRWYGDSMVRVQGTLELKCKSNQLGWKEYCPIPAPLDLSNINWGELLKVLRTYADDRFKHWLSEFDRPTLINCYMREYYETLDGQIRATVDHNPLVWDQVMYARPNLFAGTPQEQLVVLEIKSEASMHRRVSNVLSSFPSPVSRNSKYVAGVARAFCFT